MSFPFLIWLCWYKNFDYNLQVRMRFQDSLTAQYPADWVPSELERSGNCSTSQRRMMWGSMWSGDPCLWKKVNTALQFLPKHLIFIHLQNIFHNIFRSLYSDCLVVIYFNACSFSSFYGNIWIAFLKFNWIYWGEDIWTALMSVRWVAWSYWAILHNWILYINTHHHGVILSGVPYNFY